MSPSQQFFLDSIPNKFQLNEDTCSQQMLLIEKTSLLHQSLMMQTVHKQIIYLGGAPCILHVSSGRENSLKMEKTLMKLERENTIIKVVWW